MSAEAEAAPVKRPAKSAKDAKSTSAPKRPERPGKKPKTAGQTDQPEHLRSYLAAYKKETGKEPLYVETLDPAADYGDNNLVYPLGSEMFIHLRPTRRALEYVVVMPELTEEELDQMDAVRDAVFREALYREPPKDQDELESQLLKLFDEVTQSGAVSIPPDRRAAVRHRILRDVARYGHLEPFLLDPYLEDIQCVGTDKIHVIHKFYDMLKSTISFRSVEELDGYVRNLSERIGRPVSDARPIVDATLADGSRINIVYSADVSKKGPSFSIRRVHADPISITQLISWGTMTPEIAAYLWLCLENGMSLFVCGEAACGKSATLNALLAFVDPRSKIYTAEDTPEVRPPHPIWQRLLTRETGPEDARVTMFDLLRAALRSRPNYIVVGEIRGAEGAVAFQAMQTGHPTVGTFHATDKVKMIQRLSAHPIEVPLSFMDNLNVAVFQQAIYKGGRLIRRVTAIDELQGYSERDGGVVTLPVFTYNAGRDEHVFQGNNNSYILEKKIAEQHGYEDPSEIYRVLRHRAKVLKGLTEHGIFRFDDVNKILMAYHDQGDKALPFKV